MKRSLFDSEYDRVRRQSGLNQPRPEFDMDEPDAHGERVADRVTRAHEDFKQRMAELDVVNVKHAAERKVAADQRSMEANRIQLLGEYEAAGIYPPFTDDSGKPTISLSLLKRLGWRIENFGSDGNSLVPPGWRAPIQQTGENHA